MRPGFAQHRQKFPNLHEELVKRIRKQVEEGRQRVSVYAILTELGHSHTHARNWTQLIKEEEPDLDPYLEVRKTKEAAPEKPIRITDDRPQYERGHTLRALIDAVGHMQRGRAVQALSFDVQDAMRDGNYRWIEEQGNRLDEVIGYAQQLRNSLSNALSTVNHLEET